MKFECLQFLFWQNFDFGKGAFANLQVENSTLNHIALGQW